jgi:RNA polymerase sigma factor (sigma-70 family)
VELPEPHRETADVGRSFDEIFAEEFPPLHRYLRRRIGTAAAEDVAASTFATAFRRWESFDQGRPARPWLYGIAANLMRRHWRDEERKLRAYARTGVDPVAVDDEGVLERADAAARSRELGLALAALRPREREILLLHAWTDLSEQEIADALSLPLGTVKSRLHRTRERLRNRLSTGGQVPDRTTVAATPEE